MTIAGAIDAVCDAVAGEDVPARATIEESVELLGEFIGGGGKVTVEPLGVTKNGTYDGGGTVAYSPVTVNVPASAQRQAHKLGISLGVSGVTCRIVVNSMQYDNVADAKKYALASYNSHFAVSYSTGDITVGGGLYVWATAVGSSAAKMRVTYNGTEVTPIIDNGGAILFQTANAVNSSKYYEAKITSS